MKVLLGILLCLPLLAWTCTRTVESIHFDQTVGGYLARAATANTVELARVELSKAVEAAKEQKLTEGFTSVLYQTPDEDVGFWFQNLSASLEELGALPANATPLESSNMLMKLRETLVQQGEKGDSLNAPSGITVHPYNLAFTLWGWFGLTLSFLGACLLFVAWDDA